MGMKLFARVAVLTIWFGGQGAVGFAQQRTAPTEWQRVFRMPAVSGYEQTLSQEIRKRLRQFSPKTDSLENIYITLGSGAPHRLIVTPIDEPGYVVSGITGQGYLLVQRLPQRAPNDVFDLLNFAQPVIIQTSGGQQVTGVFAGLPPRLLQGRQNTPPTHLDELFVDIGATSAEEVRKAGVKLLDPLSLERYWFPVGSSGEAGPAVGDRFGAYALVQVLEQVKNSQAKGTTTIAFLTQQWIGGRGLNRILSETQPDELIFVGRLNPQGTAESASIETRPGTGVLMGSLNDSSSETQPTLAAQLQSLAKKERIPIHAVSTKEPQIQSFGKVPSLPKRWVELGVPTLWPVTPGEFSSAKDTAQLARLLAAYLEIPNQPEVVDEGPIIHRNYRRPEALIDTYGVSGHEEEIRDVISDHLDPRLQKMANTDAAGNLVLHFGDGKNEKKVPRILFVAHMDEIGYEVRKIENDGRLQVELLGEAYQQYFLGHVVLVHRKEGRPLGGVLELPAGWDRGKFEWPSPTQPIHEPLHVFVGTHSREETEKLGIAMGDSVTIPKKYHRLLGTRVSASSLDDRVGCSALITAANALGPDFSGHEVTFVWSVGKEIGTRGAAMFAKQAAQQDRVPDFVFAIDTFVSFDSPSESKSNANAGLGTGFAVRAADNSSVVPPQYVDRVVALAKENAIPVQYGATDGGNDGAPFSQYGSVDVTLGWPLLYSHSPAEMMDTRDFDALSKVVEILARKW
jgi:putative aminopeptidase FrvX